MPDAKITTRILWLGGLEPGFNRGGNVDSHARYIYIHGTADQASIGKPTSCGCIHLADMDLIPLFDLLPSGTLVWIAER
jgi:lipoprotein-anchoring transpeptidase ErfK/SrfK